MLDAKSAYWNVELNEESSYLTTLNTHKGRLIYKRMSYGLNSSQDIFQKRMDETSERCNGAIPITYIIQVFGTDDINDTHMHEAMERVRSIGNKLNFEKCVIKSKLCAFCSNVYTPKGNETRPQES